MVDGIDILLVGLGILLIYRVYSIFRNDHYSDMPTFDEYVKALPHCLTSNGVKCRTCGSKSIRNWGRESANDSQRLFICNHCNTTLYRNND